MSKYWINNSNLLIRVNVDAYGFSLRWRIVAEINSYHYAMMSLQIVQTVWTMVESLGLAIQLTSDRLEIRCFQNFSASEFILWPAVWHLAPSCFNHSSQSSISSNRCQKNYHGFFRFFLPLTATILRASLFFEKKSLRAKSSITL